MSSIASLIHGKCNTQAYDLIQAAKSSIGNNNEHLSFQLLQGIKKLKSLDSQILEYDHQIQFYVDLINPIILSIPGIRYTTAGLILGEIGDISRFANASHLISYAGLDIVNLANSKLKIEVSLRRGLNILDMIYFKWLKSFGDLILLLKLTIKRNNLKINTSM